MQSDVAVATKESAHPGQASYSRPALRFYDLFVFHYNLPVIWRCSKERLLRLYDEHVGVRHLDIGVGTGYLIDRCDFPSETPEITLMDLNPNSLNHAARRLERYSPRVHRANVMEPWRLSKQAFDSVAMVNLLHCVPGTMSDKAIIFEHAQSVLAPGGALFGATVLGAEADHTRHSRRVMARFNRRGIFSNLDDRREDLEAALSEAFAVHEVEIQGAVALFTARKAA
jgi:ubiquinone/menaquinone biosynthesis C-methylase UbiE